MRAAAMKLRAVLDPAEIKITALLDYPGFRAKFEDFNAHKRRLEQAIERQEKARKRASGQAVPAGSARERARRLVAGGTVVASSVPSEIDSSTREMLDLTSALQTIGEELTEIADRWWYEQCSEFAPVCADAYRNVDAHNAGLHEALEIPRIARARLFAALNAAGVQIHGIHDINQTALPLHTFETGAAVGNPAASHTAAGRFRQWLIDKGIA